ncbi:efflux RND transporter periplasmic adaptor subunit [candidate division KSB1 bacterium]
MKHRSCLPLSQGKRMIHTGSQAAAVATAALILLSACSSQPATRGPQRFPVSVDTLRTMSVPVEIFGIGNVEAYNTVSVRARVNGEIKRVYFREGQEVRKGDPLFLIDPEPYEAALRQAEASLARDVFTAHNAGENVKRFADLVTSDYVTRKQYDDMRAVAEALKATVKADSAFLQTARLNLGYCMIRAPISGRTGNRLVDQGNVIRTNADNPLVVINQIEPVYVNFSLPENYLAEIMRYSKLDTLRIRAYPPEEEKNPQYGSLSFVDNSVDVSTGTIRLKAVFANKDRDFWPGEFVNVTIVLRTIEDAIAIPHQAVQTGQQGDYVFVLEDDITVAMKPVKVGNRYESYAVISEGLSPGEIVVTDGHLRLFPGAPVTVTTLPEVGGQANGQ